MDSDETRGEAPAIVSVAPAGGRRFHEDAESYAVEGQIGAGGMGTVLAAKAERLGRPVALKIVTADADDLRRRFEREARVTARLQHPAIVPVYGTGRNDGQPFYVMKHVTGESLDKAIANTVMFAERIALVPKVIAVIEAIAYAHAERVIHRDLKPANILVGGFGETVVIDWGLAKDLAAGDDELAAPYRGAGDQTGVGKVMGTPAYMPLEQARGEPVDERADVYALGAILYHVLAGTPPYRRRGEDGVPWESMVARVLSGPPEPLGDDVPPDLRAVVVRAMARDADKRYPSAGELAEDLRRFQTGQLVGAHRYSTWQLLARFVRRNRAAVTVGGVLLAILAIVAFVSVRQIVEERDEANHQRSVATAQRDASDSLVEYLLTTFRDRLEPLGKVDLLGDIAARVVAHYDTVAVTSEPDAAALMRRATAMRVIARVQIQHSDRGGAEKAARDGLAAIAIARTREHDPVAAGVLESSLHGTLGTALENSDGKAARDETLVALAIARRLADTYPGDVRTRATLAIALSDAASVVERAGDESTAFDYQREAVVALDALVDEHASVALVDLPRARRLARIELARTHVHRGELDDAAAALDRIRADAESAVAKQPSDVRYRRDLYQLRFLDGSIARRREQPAVALAAYQACVELAQAAVDRDPDNDRARRDLILVLTRVAKFHRELAQLDDAEATARRAIALTEPAATDNVAIHLEDLADALEELALVMSARHRFADEVALRRRSLELVVRARAKRPDEPRTLYDVGTFRAELGQALAASGDHRAALIELDAGVALVRRAVAASPDALDWGVDAAGYDTRAAVERIAVGDVAGGRATLEHVIAELDALLASHPHHHEIEIELANALVVAARNAPGSDPARSARAGRAVELLTPLESGLDPATRLTLADARALAK